MNKEEKEIIESAMQIKRYCKNKSSCRNCILYKKTLNDNYVCRIRLCPVAWNIEENVLDDVEKQYLWNIIKPFKEKVKYIAKVSGIDEYISIILKEDFDIDLPLFQKGKMYKGMETERKYTVEELFGGK